MEFTRPDLDNSMPIMESEPRRPANVRDTLSDITELTRQINDLTTALNIFVGGANSPGTDRAAKSMGSPDSLVAALAILANAQKDILTDLRGLAINLGIDF